MNARLDLGQARRGNDLLPRKAILTPKIVNLCVCVDENAFRFRALLRKLQRVSADWRRSSSRNTGDLGAPDGDRRGAQLDGTGADESPARSVHLRSVGPPTGSPDTAAGWATHGPRTNLPGLNSIRGPRTVAPERRQIYISSERFIFAHLPVFEIRTNK